MEQTILQKIKPGAFIRVHERIKEKTKSRLNVFEGLVICRKHGSEQGATFTVRRAIQGIGVERIFPVHSPNIEKIDILRTSKVRRAKLYFLRKESQKKIRRKLKKEGGDKNVAEDLTAKINEEPKTDTD